LLFIQRGLLAEAQPLLQEAFSGRDTSRLAAPSNKGSDAEHHEPDCDDATVTARESREQRRQGRMIACGARRPPLLACRGLHERDALRHTLLSHERIARGSAALGNGLLSMPGCNASGMKRVYG
jgi:hypothetical protein